MVVARGLETGEIRGVACCTHSSTHISIWQVESTLGLTCATLGRDTHTYSHHNGGVGKWWEAERMEEQFSSVHKIKIGISKKKCVNCGIDLLNPPNAPKTIKQKNT